MSNQIFDEVPKNRSLAGQKSASSLNPGRSANATQSMIQQTELSLIGCESTNNTSNNYSNTPFNGYRNSFVSYNSNENSMLQSMLSTRSIQASQEDQQFIAKMIQQAMERDMKNFREDNRQYMKKLMTDQFSEMIKIFESQLNDIPQMIGNLKKNEKEIKLINDQVEKISATTDQFQYQSSQATNQIVYSLKTVQDNLNVVAQESREKTKELDTHVKKLLMTLDLNKTELEKQLSEAVQSIGNMSGNTSHQGDVSEELFNKLQNQITQMNFKIQENNFDIKQKIESDPFKTAISSRVEKLSNQIAIYYQNVGDQLENISSQAFQEITTLRLEVKKDTKDLEQKNKETFSLYGEITKLQDSYLNLEHQVHGLKQNFSNQVLSLRQDLRTIQKLPIDQNYFGKEISPRNLNSFMTYSQPSMDSKSPLKQASNKDGSINRKQQDQEIFKSFGTFERTVVSYDFNLNSGQSPEKVDDRSSNKYKSEIDESSIVESYYEKSDIMTSKENAGQNKSPGFNDIIQSTVIDLHQLGDAHSLQFSDNIPHSFEQYKKKVNLNDDPNVEEDGNYVSQQVKLAGLTPQRYLDTINPELNNPWLLRPPLLKHLENADMQSPLNQNWMIGLVEAKQTSAADSAGNTPIRETQNQYLNFDLKYETKSVDPSPFQIDFGSDNKPRESEQILIKDLQDQVKKYSQHSNQVQQALMDEDLADGGEDQDNSQNCDENVQNQKNFSLNCFTHNKNYIKPVNQNRQQIFDNYIPQNIDSLKPAQNLDIPYQSEYQRVIEQKDDFNHHYSGEEINLRKTLNKNSAQTSSMRNLTDISSHIEKPKNELTSNNNALLQGTHPYYEIIKTEGSQLVEIGTRGPNLESLLEREKENFQVHNNGELQLNQGRNSTSDYYNVMKSIESVKEDNHQYSSASSKNSSGNKELKENQDLNIIKEQEEDSRFFTENTPIRNEFETNFNTTGQFNTIVFQQEEGNETIDIIDKVEKLNFQSHTSNVEANTMRIEEDEEMPLMENQLNNPSPVIKQNQRLSQSISMDQKQEVVYQIDENGYLMDNQGNYILDQNQQYIQLTEEHIQYLKSANMYEEEQDQN